MAKRITNEEFDKRILSKNVKRIDDCETTKTNINFQCLSCDFIFKTTPARILYSNKLSCSKCSVGNYFNSKTPIELECLDEKCKYTCLYRLDNLARKIKCKKCNNRLIPSNEDIDIRLQNTSVKRIGNYITSRTKINFSCIKCNNIWLATPNRILCGTRCPKCSIKYKLTNDEIDQRLAGKLIKRLDNYIDYDTKIKFLCLEKSCNNIWETSIDNIKQGSGCALCNKRKNEKILIKTIAELNLNYKHNYNIKNINNLYDKNYYFDCYLPDFRLAI